MHSKKSIFSILIVSLLLANDCFAEKLPLGKYYDVEYLGAWRLQEGTFGKSRMAYAKGTFAVSDDDQELFIAGHSHHFAVGSFKLGAPTDAKSVKRLAIAPNLQPFVPLKPTFIHKSGNPRQITGMDVIGDELFVNVTEFYDADANNENTTLVFENKNALPLSGQKGFFQMTGRAHASGWISKVPESLVDAFDSTHITGNASNLSINSRLSIGPSLFTWFPYFLPKATEQTGKIVTIPYLDYSTINPLHKDQYNKSGENQIWTEVTGAYYGFLTPNGKHYLIVGTSGGHKSGIGYKIKQDNGNICGGPCPYQHDDYSNFFWVYSVDDLLKVKEGKIAPHDPRPIDYGKFSGFTFGHNIRGADYNPYSNTLYVYLPKADKTQNRYEPQAVIAAFRLSER